MRGHTPHKALNVCIKCGGVFKRGRGLLSHLELATESCEKVLGCGEPREVEKGKVRSPCYFL